MRDVEEHDELIMSLVEEALRTLPGEREERLRSLCRDPEVYTEVLDRVTWEERMGRFLLDPLIDRPLFADPLSPGHLLDHRFRIIRKVGFGGMGIVFEAVDEKLDRRVALKCARLGHGHRLPPEARAAREVSHFNVCKVHDLHNTVTEFGEMDYLSMEFIEGQTLAERISREGPLPEKESREIARQICAGLAQAHRQGVVHGDLKCSNVLLTRSGGGLRAVVTDFGLARVDASGGGRSSSGGRGGTLDYMAPELLRANAATAASDIYALGVLFHVMLTGRSPERVDSTPSKKSPSSKAMHSAASTVTLLEEPAAPAWERRLEPLPPRWKSVVRSCIAADPRGRFASADEIGAALDARPSKLVWVGMSAAALVAALGIWQWTAHPPPPVRLAVLPFSLEGDPVRAASGIASDIAERLSGVRRNFSVIGPREAQTNQADTPAKARRAFGATHVLQARLRGAGSQIVMEASVSALDSGQTLARIQGSYATTDTPLMAKAVLAAVDGAFQLRTTVPRESVSGAAYGPYVQGVDLLRRDSNANAAAAIPYFEQAVQYDPASALPYAGLAEAQLSRFTRGDGPDWLERAGESIVKAKSINSDAVPVLLASGSYEQHHGRYEQAVREFTRALEMEPANAVGLRRLAEVYQNTNRPEEAIAAYRKALDANSGDFRVYSDLGNFYFFRNQFTQAEQQYRQAAALVPGVATPRMNIGLALIRQHRIMEAEQELLEALKLRRYPLLLMNLGGLYYQQERFGEAAKYFEESVAAGAGSNSVYRDLGDAYRHLGRIAEAADAYVKARSLAEKEVTLNPRSAASRVRLGLVSAFLGNRSRADFELAQALALEPENPAVIREAAIAYTFLGSHDKAIDILRNAPSALLQELNHQPDVKDLQQDPRFQEQLRNNPRSDQ